MQVSARLVFHHRRNICRVVDLQAIGRDGPLLSTHRLDTCTEGVLITGKTKAFVRHFNDLLLVPGKIQKTYRALTRSPLQPGGARSSEIEC